MMDCLSSGNEAEMETEDEIASLEEERGPGTNDESCDGELYLPICPSRSPLRFQEDASLSEADPPSTSSNSKRDFILGELGDELEKQLEEKATRNELSAINVKSLLKAVLTHEDVRKYVEFAMDQTEEPPEYQLMLTRAKARELIGKLPQISPVLCVPSTPIKKSEINILVEESLSDDSEDDDDYVPPDDAMDDDDESRFTNGDDSSVVSLMSPRPDISVPSSPVRATASESVGNRTRSKFSLVATPLELIERAFVPPDVSEDMYDPVSGSQEWLDFLKGLAQPLDPQADSAGARASESDAVDDNDDENDPEYNVMSDVELEAPDVEEFRNDRTVKISKKEKSELMSELAEYMKMLEEGCHSDEENGEADEAIDDLINAQPLPSVPEVRTGPVKDVRDEETRVEDAADDVDSSPQTLFLDCQIRLLEQQLTQHVQLLLQTYLLSLGNPFVNASVRESSKACLVELKDRADANPDSVMSLPFWGPTFDLMEKYGRYVSSKKLSFEKWHREVLQSLRKNSNLPIHPDLMDLCLLSSAFPYPLLLPAGGFKPDRYQQKNSFSETTDRLICFGLEDCAGELCLNTVEGLRVACDRVRSVLVPDKRTDSIVNHVRFMQKAQRRNPIKDYFSGLGVPDIKHYVSKPTTELLYQKDPQLIGNTWHVALYKMRDRMKHSPPCNSSPSSLGTSAATHPSGTAVVVGPLIIPNGLHTNLLVSASQPGCVFPLSSSPLVSAVPLSYLQNFLKK